MGVGIIFMFWSGSRTGILTGIIGLAVLLRTRIGLWLGVGIVCAILIMIGMHFLGDQITGTAHLFATNDSRSVVWGRLWNAFLANPLIGNHNEGEAGESSYLSVAACFGLYGLLPMLLTLSLIWNEARKLNRARSNFGSGGLLPNIVLAWILSISLVWAFECYLIGTTTDFVFTLYIMLAIMTFLMDPPMMRLMQMEQASQMPYNAAAGYQAYWDSDGMELHDPLLGHSVPAPGAWEEQLIGNYR